MYESLTNPIDFILLLLLLLLSLFIQDLSEKHLVMGASWLNIIIIIIIIVISFHNLIIQTRSSGIKRHDPPTSDII